jgi:hypothetical protein
MPHPSASSSGALGHLRTCSGDSSASAGLMLRSRSTSSLSRQSSRECFLFRSESESSRSHGSLPLRLPITSRGSRDLTETAPAPEVADRDREAQSTAVRVVVRFRPPMPSEEPSVDGKQSFTVDTCENFVETADLQHRFQFDRVFDQSASQSSVYADVALPLVRDLLQGYNATILAYGQTGGGKTYCMFGPQGHHPVESQGLVPRAAEHIFENVSAGQIECSFVEVYCEQIRDLLTTGYSKLQVKETPTRGFWVDGLTHRSVQSTTEVLQALRNGLKHRAAANTRLNQHSSRSHAIFTLHVVQETAEGIVRQSKLTLVDLAGSEKVAKSGSAGDTLEEAKKINSSLSALGHVIDALAEKRPHVPYRDSRLTRLLEDSLGGNCRTTLLAACSPITGHFSETLSSLRFAGRAKKVCNMVYLPQWSSVDRQLVNRITALRRELSKAHQQLEERMQDKTASSPRKAHRPLLRSLGEEIRQYKLVTDSGGTSSQTRLHNGQAASWSSLPTVPGCHGGTPLLDTRAVPATFEAQEPQIPLYPSGASREDCIASTGTTMPPERDLVHAVVSAVMSPPESSDAASTAIGSASSSGVVLYGNSTSVTPMSSAWDADDDFTGRKLGRVEILKGDPRDSSQPPARHSSIVGSLEAALGKKHYAQETDADPNAGDVHIQQDLNWKLELERHRNAALNFELGRRAQESEDLRRQLAEAESMAQSWAPGYIPTNTPRLGSGVSMPLLPHVPLQAGTTTILTTSTNLSFIPACTAVHAVPCSTVQRTPSSQLAPVHQVIGSNSERPSVHQAQVIGSSGPARTSSHSPLRQQRASYSGGLQHAQASVASNAPWASPRQTGVSCTSLHRSSSQGGRFYPPVGSMVALLVRPLPGHTVWRPRHRQQQICTRGDPSLKPQCLWCLVLQLTSPLRNCEKSYSVG